MKNKHKHLLSVAVLCGLIILAVGSVDYEDGNPAKAAPPPQPQSQPQPDPDNSDQSNNGAAEEGTEVVVVDNTPDGFPPEPKLGKAPEKPDLKAIYAEKLSAPDKYEAKWVPPKVGDAIKFADLKGQIHEGKLVECGDDYIKMSIDAAGKVKVTYKRDKMRKKYRIKYLKSEFIKQQAYDDVMEIQSKYKAEYTAYIKPKVEWERKVRRIKDDKIRADVINRLADAEDAQKKAEMLAHGPRPTMTTIGWSFDTIPAIILQILKKAMHDFDSFQKVSGQLFYTEYKGVKCWVYDLTYRGTNAFGAKVINSAKFWIRNDVIIGVKE